MERGLSEKYNDRISPVGRHFDRITELGAPDQILPQMNKMTSEVIRMYAFAAQEYLRKYPGQCSKEDFARIAVKNREHGIQNPRACFYGTAPLSLEKALTDRILCDPITVHQSSLTADGSACAIVCSQRFLEGKVSYDKRPRAIQILGQQMSTDLPSSFSKDKGFMSLSGYDMAKSAAAKCYQ